MFTQPINKIFVLKISDSSDISEFSTLLTEKRKAAAQKNPLTDTALTGIFGEIILQAVAKAFKGEKGILGYGDHGKPYFENFPDFHFNISHSGKYVAVAFSKKEIGVDIEAVRDVNLKIAGRFFTEQEKEFAKNAQAFFCVWTRKEAYVKKTGCGISIPLNSFESLENEKIKTYETRDFTLSVCCDETENFEIIYITQNDLKL